MRPGGQSAICPCFLLSGQQKTGTKRGNQAAGWGPTMSGMGFDRSLATGEEVVAILHPHWKTLVRPILLTFVVVAVLLIGEVLIPASGAADGERLALAVLAIVLLVPQLAHIGHKARAPAAYSHHSTHQSRSPRNCLPPVAPSWPRGSPYSPRQTSRSIAAQLAPASIHPARSVSIPLPSATRERTTWPEANSGATACPGFAAVGRPRPGGPQEQRPPSSRHTM